jgi:hypothetical protein
VHLRTPDPHGPVEHVDLHLAQADDRPEPHRRAAGPPQERQHPGEQLLRAEGQDEVVVHAELERRQHGLQVARRDRAIAGTGPPGAPGPNRSRTRAPPTPSRAGSRSTRSGRAPASNPRAPRAVPEWCTSNRPWLSASSTSSATSGWSNTSSTRAGASGVGVGGVRVTSMGGPPSQPRPTAVRHGGPGRRRARAPRTGRRAACAAAGPRAGGPARRRRPPSPDCATRDSAAIARVPAACAGLADGAGSSAPSRTVRSNGFSTKASHPAESARAPGSAGEPSALMPTTRTPAIAGSARTRRTRSKPSTPGPVGPRRERPRRCAPWG